MLLEIKKYLYDIKQAIEEIESFLKDKTYQDFTNTPLFQSAVERKFEIIGEALNRIKKVDEKFLEKMTDANKIISFRNVIAHGYDIVDTEIIWDAIEFNLPKLKSEIANLLTI